MTDVKRADRVLRDPDAAGAPPGNPREGGHPMTADFQLVDPTPRRITEADMLDALMARYDKTIFNGTWNGARYIRAAHVSSELSYKAKRIADFIAMDTQSHRRGDWRDPDQEYQQAPVFHGHEIKVSRSDWLTELKDSTKADAFKRYMHLWWLVVPDKSIRGSR